MDGAGPDAILTRRAAFQLLESRLPVTGTSRKKVIVRKFSRDWQAGYVDPQGFVRDGRLELLDLAGTVVAIELHEVKRICFVREFLSGENPERLVRKNFASRPRASGLWLRMRLRDGEEIEGLAGNDATLLEKEGIQFVPPDLRSNTQRIFVPREAIESMEVVAVIHAGSRRRRAVSGEDIPDQEGLFSAASNDRTA